MLDKTIIQCWILYITISVLDDHYSPEQRFSGLSESRQSLESLYIIKVATVSFSIRVDTLPSYRVPLYLGSGTVHGHGVKSYMHVHGVKSYMEQSGLVD